ncbi:MAG: hypothetical protein KJZ93_28685, partial [Caldilineaceae bacterium]|nr:hypothetical protein [Caldilineaceae bacterium]
MKKHGIYRAIGWLVIVSLLVQILPPQLGQPTSLLAHGDPATLQATGRMDVPDGLLLRWQEAVAAGSVACAASTEPTIQQNIFLPLVSGVGAGSTSQADAQLLDPLLPPSAASVAPPVDLSAPTDIFAATRFLYTGSTPLQIEVAPDLITPLRVAVLHGQVLNQAGDPLPGVEVAIAGRPEYGCTFSSTDGAYDLVVNAGDTLTLRFRLANHLVADRPVTPLARDYLTLDDVVLLPYDSQVTAIDFSEPMQIARGSQVNDSSGSRQATLLFPQNAAPQFVMADGSVRAASATLHVRATEYSVGERGPNAMPAPLPPNSGYTYAVDFTVDEAELAGAVSVEFGEPVINYVENFLNFPAGSAVPTGYYDRQEKRWVPADNGRVIQIVAVQRGLAAVDTTGDGAADNGAALGMTTDERSRLAALYTAGQSLWRVPIRHFTPWDHNWPYGPPTDAAAPEVLDSLSPQAKGPDSDDATPRCGSVIEVENQILRKSIPLVGAPCNLYYASDRFPGRRVANQIDIPLSNPTAPASLKRIDLQVAMAGHRFTQEFPPQPNQIHTFEWDGTDVYGRTLQGAQPVTVRLGYVYEGVYQEPGQFEQAFANFSGVPMSNNRTRQEITLYQEWRGVIGGVDFQRANAALAGWNLGVHHLYDPVGKVLYYGDGTRRSANGIVTQGINTYAGNGESCLPNLCTGDGGPAEEAQLGSPGGIATGPDGSLYLANNTRVRKVNPLGIISTVAGGGNPADGVGDGLPATEARLFGAQDVAIGPDGSLYILEGLSYRIRRVAPDGVITTVAGAGERGYSGDGGPATEAQLFNPAGLAVGPDGSIYISERSGNHIRRVGPNGIITTIAGTGQGCGSHAAGCGDGGRASEAQFTAPGRLAIGPDGSLYVSSSGWGRLRRISPDGIISTVARVSLAWQGQGIAFGPDGSLHISWYHGLGGYVFRVQEDGSLTVVAGAGASGYSGDGGPAAQARFRNTEDIAIGPDGTIYILDQLNHRIRRVAEILPGFSGEETPIPAPDGSELYIFDAQGRHLRTRHGLTGATIYEFSYDDAGRLAQIKDSDGNTTLIERTASGVPTAIVVPFGQRTALTVDGNGFLASVTNPAGETVQLVTSERGLLTRFTNPRGQSTQYEYDVRGRLVRIMTDDHDSRMF